MKSIALVTDSNSTLATFLKENLKEVLMDKVTINNYFLNELTEDSIIEDDIVLVMIQERAYQIKKYINKNCKIIVLRRTFIESELLKVFSIPTGTDVLIVNDNKATTYEIISLFYELGLNHLNLIPYYENRDYSSIYTSITPGETRFVPNFIKNIINIKDRCISVTTFIKIISELNIRENQINENLIRYSEKIVNLDIGIRDTYKELYLRKEELNTIINLSKDGIVFTNNDGNITICNNKFKEILSIEKNLIGENIKSIFCNELETLVKADYINDEVYTYKNKFINVNKSVINNFNMLSGCLYNLQEITYIKQLEASLNKKIKAQGQFARYHFNNIITNSSIMLEKIALAKKISFSDLTALITGESGTGKELFAQSIHNNSSRCNYPFIAVNCAAMPENLLESELFGYEGGAFTGALKEGKKGLFEQANGGTIFLDEIGDMPYFLQTKLLRVLQERQVVKIGSNKVIDINIRIIAATNQDLLKLVAEGKFRQDLYYRLNVLPLHIPPLKERKEDIIDLLTHFIEKPINITNDGKRALVQYNWPGNIRELQNLSSYLSLMCENNIDIIDLPDQFKNTEYNYNNNEYFEEQDFLENKYSIEIVLSLLKEIEFLNNMNEGVGRNRLRNILEKKGFFLTENDIRKLMLDLNKLGLIQSKKGRKGSSLSLKGLDFLSNIK